MIEIVVISLPEAETRRRLMRAQLEQPGMPPHRFVDGVDGRRLDVDELRAIYDEAAARRHVGRPLTAPEIGCAASHLAAYRQIVERSVPLALVLEDDALLGHQFLKVLIRLLPLFDAGRPQAVLLSHVLRYSAWHSRRVDRLYGLYRPYLAHGAHAYLINLHGARAMHAALTPLFTVADDWRHFARAGILEIRALIPYLVGTSPLSGDSQIGPARFAEALRNGNRNRPWRKLAFQLAVKPALRLRKQKQTW